MKKIITPELINQRLEAKGFGEKQEADYDTMREAVLNYYHVELIDEWDDDAGFFIYEETTADGYTIYIATDNPRYFSPDVIYYYDNKLSDVLSDEIRFSNGEFEYPEKIYVDDLEASYVDDAIQEEFQYLASRFEEEVLQELNEEGYETEE